MGSRTAEISVIKILLFNSLFMHKVSLMTKSKNIDTLKSEVIVHRRT